MGVDPKKITAIVDQGDRPAERICNHVIPEFKPDLLIIGSIGKNGIVIRLVHRLHTWLSIRELRFS